MGEEQASKGLQALKSSHRHWEEVYQRQPVASTSWFQLEPSLSLRLIENAGLNRRSSIIDVGGGASTLVDHLARSGFDDLTVLDISNAALHAARARLGSGQHRIKWIEQDILEFEPRRTYDLGHDRALFHFMTSEANRQRYLANLGKALAPGSNVVLATFASDGPERCSGLLVQRYDAGTLLRALGPDFTLVEQLDEDHLTPAGNVQRFSYFHLRRL
jgi:SAM-dependent methyltransferase